MQHITTHALVLRSVPYKESSRMLTVLTAEHGKLAVSARGASRKGSRVLAAVQPLVFSEMTLAVSRERYTLTEAHVVEQFRELTEDLAAFALGNYVAELLEAVSDEDAPSPELLSLGLNALYALGENKRPREIIKAATEMRLMRLAGYAPALDNCRVCGASDGAHLDLSGGLLCDNCAGQSSAAVPLGSAALDALRYVVSADAKRLYSFALDDTRGFAAACEAYTLYQLGRGFRTLDYYKNLGG